ncbi:MlaE family ABC transporter permease [Algiphilus sp.]|uniref:MlaE family ABC transporter permease n=1 Tax=Algiphilus sp. TaxID=1872431 RepID=UPI0025C088D6|nr:ABC transporter permease [Algiphilus sp.]MCK5771625.1 ABC transporter permease [Algiphilus sp.]
MSARVARSSEGDALQLTLSGAWCLDTSPDAGHYDDDIAQHRRLLVRVDADAEWDSSLPAFVAALTRAARAADVVVEIEAPERLERLLALGAGSDDAVAGRERATAWRLPDLRPPLRFVGHLLLAIAPARALPQLREVLRVIRQTSSRSLPIVGLVNFLVGGILAFIGAVQLRTFGAEIYVADLVGIATAREMAALITAVVLSGRLSAAFAAEIATMQGNEEIDALRTAGVDPVRYLAVPRVAALLLAMPILFAAACITTLAGGLAVATGMLDIPPAAYLLQTRNAVGLDQFWIGLSKAMAFAAFLGAAGCYYGLRAERTAAAVGDATTRAVVSSMVGIICIDAVFAVICNALGI